MAFGDSFPPTGVAIASVMHRVNILAEVHRRAIEQTKNILLKPGHAPILASDGSNHDIRTTRLGLAERQDPGLVLWKLP